MVRVQEDGTVTRRTATIGVLALALTACIFVAVVALFCAAVDGSGSSLVDNVCRLLTSRSLSPTEVVLAAVWGAAVIGLLVALGVILFAPNRWLDVLTSWYA
jgi:hypothetical protein